MQNILDPLIYSLSSLGLFSYAVVHAADTDESITASTFASTVILWEILFIPKVFLLHVDPSHLSLM